MRVPKNEPGFFSNLDLGSVIMSSLWNDMGVDLVVAELPMIRVVSTGERRVKMGVLKKGRGPDSKFSWRWRANCGCRWLSTAHFHWMGGQTSNLRNNSMCLRTGSSYSWCIAPCHAVWPRARSVAQLPPHAIPLGFPFHSACLRPIKANSRGGGLVWRGVGFIHERCPLPLKIPAKFVGPARSHRVKAQSNYEARGRLAKPNLPLIFILCKTQTPNHIHASRACLRDHLVYRQQVRHEEVMSRAALVLAERVRECLGQKWRCP